MQVVRAFSGFQYRIGDRGPDKPATLRMVPCVTAKRNRQVAAIQRNMSENTLLTVPMISVDITGFEPDRERMQNPAHVDTIQVNERAKDIITGEYTSERGTAASISRIMPRPYMLTLQVDVWTSNMDQKFQLLEQIDTIIFPGFDIQNSDNALDWSALTTVTFESQVYSSISLPIGTDDEIDVATITLKIPMWITPPAVITRQRLIQQVITNINQADVGADGALANGETLVTNITTPNNHCLKVERGILTLMGPSGNETDDEVYSWDDLLAMFSAVVRPGETQVRLRRDLGDETSDIVGVIFPTENPNQVQWQPDIATLPANTVPSVTGIIDPQRSVPGEGGMEAAAEGQRYLLIDDLAGPSQVWGEITARAGAVIQYTSGAWTVSFAATNHQQTEYVTNRNTGRQLVWDVQQQSWLMAIDGVFNSNFWFVGTV